MYNCQCLFEIENNLPRTKYCFVACKDQQMILKSKFEDQLKKHI